MLRRRLQHAAMAVHVAAASPVPFWIRKCARQRFMVRISGRKIKMQPQPRRGAFVYFGKCNLIMVIRCLLRSVIGIIIYGPVQVHRFRPGQDRFKPVQNKAVLSVRFAAILAQAKLSLCEGGGRGLLVRLRRLFSR